jgi:hypothetical protein
MFLAAVIVVGTWFAAHHLPHGEARAESTTSLVASRPQQVQSVSIDTPVSAREARRLPLAELRALLTTKPGDQLDAFKLEADRRALEESLVARGYLAAQVSAPSVTFGKNGGAFVVFDVDRGPMYRVRSVKVTGPGANEVITVSEGDEAIRTRVDGARQALVDASRTKAPVDVVLHEDAATASLDVELVTH